MMEEELMNLFIFIKTLKQNLLAVFTKSEIFFTGAGKLSRQTEIFGRAEKISAEL